MQGLAALKAMKLFKKNNAVMEYITKENDLISNGIKASNIVNIDDSEIEDDII